MNNKVELVRVDCWESSSMLMVEQSSSMLTDGKSSSM